MYRKDGSRTQVAINTIAIPGDREDPERPVAIIQISAAEPLELADTGADARLHIHTLGRFTLSYRGCCLPLEQWPRKQSVQLLKYFCANVGRPIHREQLIAHLWPDVDEKTGWARLKVTIHFLRQRFREAGLLQAAIVTEDESYSLRRDCVWIDSEAFADLVRRGWQHQQKTEPAEALHSFEEARRLYSGDYMEGDLYADWCAENRASLLELYLDMLSSMAELHFARGEFAASAQDCHTLLVREPCREDAHRLLIRSLIAMHRPDQAIHQFHRCEETLRRELGVSPTPQTQALVASLAVGEVSERA